MARFLLRSIISFLLAALILFCAAVSGCNGYLMLTKRAIAARVNAAAFPCGIVFRDIYFLPPFRLYMKDVSISNGEETLVDLPLLRMDISPWSLLAGRLSFSGVRLYSPELYPAAAGRFLKDHYDEVLSLLQKFKASCGRFSAKAVRVRDAKNSGLSDIDLSFREGVFKGRGSFSVPLSFVPLKEISMVASIAQGPVEWNIRGSFGPSRFAVDKCELKGERFSAQLWGELENGEMLSHGYLLFNRSLSRRVMRVIALRGKPFFLEWKEEVERFLIELLFGRKKESGSVWQGESLWEDIRAGADTDMLEMDCRLKLRLPRIDLKRLHLTFNKLPLTVKGSVSLDQPVSFELDLVSSMLPGETSSPYALHGWLIGSLRPGGLESSGELDIDLRQPEKGGWRSARLRFSDMACLFRPASKVSLSAREVRFLMLHNEEKRSLRLEDLDLLMLLDNERHKYLIARSSWAGGKAKASCRLDTSASPMGIKAFIDLRGAEAGRLAGLAGYFSHLSGKVDGKAVIAFPRGKMTGSLRMGNGILRDFEFFAWLEDFFSIPGLGRIDFDGLGTEFWISREGAGVTSLSLLSAKTCLDGDYGISNGRINGNLTLSLPRALLKKAPRFRPLLKLVDRKRDALNFSFRLSGRPEAMNFLWLQSDFKRELQDAIPGFIERSIQRNVEKMIEGLTAE